MSYEEFIVYFKNMITEKAAEGENPKFEFDAIRKVNGMKECMLINTNSENIKKTIYFDDIYKDYSRCANMDTVYENVMDAIEEDSSYIDTDEIISIIEDINSVREKITFFVINAAYNTDFLRSLPHRHYLDLAIVYKFSLFKRGEVIGKVMITNEMIKNWGITEEDLYEISLQNTEKLFPTVIKSIRPDFKIVTNSNSINGASAILNKEMFRDMAEEIEDNLYIVPSSVHELIILKASNHTPKEVRGVIYNVNTDILNVEDLLSYNLYVYDKEKDAISICVEEGFNYS